MRILLCATLLAAHTPANARQEYHLGWEPSKRAQLAMPLAKCIWQKQFSDTLAFVQELERGIKANAALERLSALELACPKIAREGDVIAALVHSRELAVSDCIAAKAGRSYRSFLAAGRKKSGSDRQVFIDHGFPDELRAAADACDSSLTADFARQERTIFAGRIWGWQ